LRLSKLIASSFSGTLRSVASILGDPNLIARFGKSFASQFPLAMHIDALDDGGEKKQTAEDGLPKRWSFLPKRLAGICLLGLATGSSFSFLYCFAIGTEEKRLGNRMLRFVSGALGFALATIVLAYMGMNLLDL